MDTTVKQRVCGLLGGVSYVSTLDVGYTYIKIKHYFLLF